MLPLVSFATNPSVVARRLGAETVLVHLHTNAIYNLNPTATRLWELVREGLTSAQIQSRLTTEFEVDTDHLEREIGETMKQLVEHGLIQSP